MSRIVVWFSCGAASACAAKLAVDKYGHENTHVVYCNTLITEHPDPITDKTPEEDIECGPICLKGIKEIQ
jgi:hypothetical protein